MNGRLWVALLSAGTLLAIYLWSSLSEIPPGVRYSSYDLVKPFRRVHATRVDRAYIPEQYVVDSILTSRGLLERAQLSTLVSSYEETHGKEVIAAITGTFTGPRGYFGGAVRGPYLANGEAVVSSNHNPLFPSFGMSSDGSLWIGDVDLRASVVLPDQSQIEANLNIPDRARAATILSPAAFTGASATENTEIKRLPSVGGDLLFRLEPTFSSYSAFRLGDVTGEFIQRFRFRTSLWDGITDFRADEIILSLPPQYTDPFERNFTEGNERPTITVSVFAEQKRNYGGCSHEGHILNAGDAQLVTSGGTVLLWDNSGTVEINNEILERPQTANPLSSICWNEQYLYFVVADGIRFSLTGAIRSLLGLRRSQGMTLSDLALFMQEELECRCAIEMDGGKSAALYFGGELANQPAAGAEWIINGPLVLARK